MKRARQEILRGVPRGAVHGALRGGLAAALGLALASGALAASHGAEADEMPATKKYERSDTATIERLEADAIVVADPRPAAKAEGATLRYETDADTVVMRPDGHEAGLDALRVGDRVTIDAHARLDEGNPVAKVIHVVVEAGGDAGGAQ